MSLFHLIYRRGSVRTRLMIWNVCIVALLLALLGGIVQYSAENVLLDFIDKRLLKETTRFERQAHSLLLRDSYLASTRYGEPGPHGFHRPNHAPQHRGNGPRLQRQTGSTPQYWGGPSLDRYFGQQAQPLFIPRVINLRGIAMAPYDKVGPWDKDAFQQALQNRPVFSEIVVNGEPIRVLSTPILWRGNMLGVLQAVHQLSDVNRAILGMKQTLQTLIPVGLLFAAIGGATITRRALKPVGQIAATADQIDAQDLRQRLSIVGSDEFSHLAMTFNRMLDRLEAAFTRQQKLVSQLETLLEQQKRFIADASHELKTPLAIAKLHAGLLIHSRPTEAEYTESVEYIDTAVDRMSHLIQDLLLLARSDAEQPGRRKDTLSLMSILDQAHRLTMVAKGAPIQLEATSLDLTVVGDEDELIRVFSNLFSNALRHTPPDGTITVHCSRQQDQITVRVSDTGEGIAPEHLPHLGERFYRIDLSRVRTQGGSGLGLSISKSLLEQHRGTIAFESTLSQGTTVIVTLPAKSG